VAHLVDPPSTTPPEPDPVPPASTSEAPVPPATSAGAAAELEVGLAAFLPEGVALADADADDGPDDDGPEPAGARSEPVEPADALGGPGGPGGGPDDGIDLDLLVHLEADLDAVGDALAALDDGTYGACAVCGAAIPPEVLAADPVRRGCDAHLPSIT
jgi:hypothetical protein